jgi:putative transposase
VVGVAWSTLCYKSRKKPQEALRRRLREVAATHVRYGYRRLTVLLRRKCTRAVPINVGRRIS